MAFEIYLGANTPKGFFSYFEDFAAGARYVYILKGGPGCGKSTLMKKLAAFGEENGQETVWIYCSSDSDSLDGVFFPKHGILYVDGTAPHALEAGTPGAHEMLLDLGQCFDTAALSANRDKIRALNTELAGEYSRCYAYLRAAGEIKRNADALFPIEDASFAKRTRSLARRTIPRAEGGSEGKICDVFLSSFTKNGLEKRQIPESYHLIPIYDPASRDGAILKMLAETAKENGFTVYAAHDPYDPEGEPMHLLIPRLKLAFVSAGRPFGYENAPARHIRLDAQGTGAQEKQSIRKDRKLQRMLEMRAQDALNSAKRIHDELEKLYSPHVDFKKVDAITKSELDRLAAIFGLDQR